LKTRKTLAALTTVALLGACSAGESVGDRDGDGSDGDGGSYDPSDPFGGLNGIDGSVLDVELGEVVRPFWTPPAFVGTGCEGETGMWGQAVQQALWFFHVNKSGPGVTNSYIQWRGDSHLEDGHIKLIAGDPNGVNMSAEYIEQYRDVLDPDGNGEVDMSGGFYDAGDFLKIGITTNFMAHSLGWSMWEFPETYHDTGLHAEALGLLRWYADYAMKNTYIENPDEPDPWKWNVIAYGHQVGAASDHECGWMPPELRSTSFCPRMGFFVTHENPAADVTAGAAAALALAAWHHANVDPEYAVKALHHAIALYEFAKQYPATKWSVDGGLYESEDGYDDLAWAAIWLHEVLPREGQANSDPRTAAYAAHRADYLDDLVTPGASWLERFRGQGPQISCIEQGGNCWAEGWTYVWNSLRSGVFVKLAEILSRSGNVHGVLAEGMQNIARDDSLAWVVGPHTEGGFAKKVDVSWGSGRYNSGGQFVALAYARVFPDDVVPASTAYDAAGISGQNTAEVLRSWAKGQSEYLLGDNPLGQSYMMGYGEDYAAYAHHAATHASIYGLCNNPEESKHIAYGALVSGPNSGDSHSDDRCDYGANEITIDYNGAFIGALAGNYAANGRGQCPDPDFPPVEPPFDEFYTKAKLNTDSGCSTQVEFTLVNETAHPPRYDQTLTVRYYLDASELQAKGLDPRTLRANVIYENFPEEPAVVSELKACTLNTSTYYYEFSFPYDFWGEQVKLKGPRTVLVDVGVTDNGSCTYDSSNDWSPLPLTDTVEKSPSLPVYSEGTLVWGAEPECDEPPRVVVPPPVVR
jgi:hypothetical protein